MPSTAEMSLIIRKLVQLGKNDDSRSLFESLSLGGITGRITEVEEAEDTLGVERWHVVQFFKSLGETGCGRFIVGRKGHASRFEWEYEPMNVAAVALRQRADLAPLGEEEADDGEDTSEKEPVSLDTEEVVTDEEPDASASSTKLVDHSYALRPDFTVRLRLPVTLNKVEAERLAAFIRTLPFDQGA